MSKETQAKTPSQQISIKTFCTRGVKHVQAVFDMVNAQVEEYCNTYRTTHAVPDTATVRHTVYPTPMPEQERPEGMVIFYSVTVVSYVE